MLWRGKKKIPVVWILRLHPFVLGLCVAFIIWRRNIKVTVQGHGIKSSSQNVLRWKSWIICSAHIATRIISNWKISYLFTVALMPSRHCVYTSTEHMWFTFAPLLYAEHEEKIHIVLFSCGCVRAALKVRRQQQRSTQWWRWWFGITSWRGTSEMQSGFCVVFESFLRLVGMCHTLFLAHLLLLTSVFFFFFPLPPLILDWYVTPLSLYLANLHFLTPRYQYRRCKRQCRSLASISHSSSCFISRGHCYLCQ